jgi:hypothetical protein
VGRWVVHHHDLSTTPQRRSQEALQVGLEDLPRRCALNRQARPPEALSRDARQSRVTFLPQLRGVLPKALAPLRDQAYSGESETLAPISSTNTSRSASTFPATSILQAALRNSSRSPAPSDLFFGSTLGA